MTSPYLSIHEYPLPSRHVGAALGNSYLGLYAWGEDRLLSITIGCGALWDHRGGMKWSPKQNYRAILERLNSQNPAALAELFPAPERYYGYREIIPCIIPVGRIDITLPEGCRLLRNELDRSQGEARAVYTTPAGEKAVSLRLDMTRKGLFAFQCDEEDADVKLLSSHDCCLQDVKGALDPLVLEKFPLPTCVEEKDFSCFVQEMPADPAFGVAMRHSGKLYTLFYRQGAPKETLMDEFRKLQPVRWEDFAAGVTQWWRDFWKRVPVVKTGDAVLDEIYLDGLYKYASMTAEDGVPAGLQGPWIEDCGFPPWSSDYHLNINLEMCYWPGYRAGLFGNLRRMLDMVWSWRDILRYNAKCYLGIEDGYMLPHAVDDRCTCMGNFWTGAVDHACTAWMAQLMYDYYDYTGDEEYLRQVAFPFMTGAMNVYLAQMDDTGDALSLPLTTSPEYGASDFDAWGKDASFQLAACHRLNRNLIEAADILGLPQDPRWTDVEKRLPQACIATVGDKKLIALWEGQLLEESHRHHSHLAGLVPFDTLDPQAPEWKEIVDSSYDQWVEKGMGLWTGWCMSWAAMLNTHLDHPEAAQTILHLWKRFFTNKGGGSTHDAQFPGLTLSCTRHNIMQMDGAMGCLTAVQDAFLHRRNGVLHLFAGIPLDIKNASFHGMHAPGGFRIDGERTPDGTRIRITATRKQHLRLVCHCRANSVSQDGTPKAPCAGEIAMDFEANESHTLEFR